MLKVIVGGIVGGLIATAWGFISWGVFSWHDLGINKFCDQEHVAHVIKENTTVDGVYIAPSCRFKSSEMRQKSSCRNTKMPFVYAQVRKEGFFCSPKTFFYAFLSQFIGACLISLLLMKIVDTCYGKRLFSVAIIGLTVGILGLVPNWVWFGSGYRFTLIMLIDTFIQWFLVGLFLAKFIQPRSTRAT